MRFSSFIAAAVLASVPGAARADRGALTLELSPAVTWWPAWGPAIGSGAGVSGSTAGGLLGLRYALRHDLELTASGLHEAPAIFTNPGTAVGTDAGRLTGTSKATVSRWGVLLGARWVHGLVWRWFVGGELGWASQSLTKLDHVDVSDPSNPHSFGLGLTDRSKSAFVIEPFAGVEWQFSDHWSVAVTPRVQVMVGGAGRVAIVLPVSLGYSWYGP